MLGELQKRQDRATVLVVDDELISREVIKECLSSAFNVITASSGEEAIVLATEASPDLVILDIMMEKIDGWSTCSIMKSSPHICHIPIIFATSCEDDDAQLRCWEAGCVDFITKPINFATLEHRVKTHVTHKLQTEHLETLSKRDVLTKVLSRRALEEDYPVIAGHCRRSGSPCSILIADIDDFKLYNDTYGHLPGDNALCAVAKVLSDTLKRVTDRIYRFGGEEFVIILPNADFHGAKLVASRLNSTLEQQWIEHAASPMGCITISIGGVACSAEEMPTDVTQVLGIADGALYQAKALGKNGNVVVKMAATKPEQVLG
ncbi:hypothetical protein ATY37_02055 [Vibrio cidicii]|uniref:diguanylate cyclase n=1 Tax=Vibrio cidicii TaxID=1763883 RepID=A0A151KRI0_9VIBR|nr:diguanylate cyclase [Vibrio cidicii]KYN79675.1 hypothetical protein ATY37_02055 [Vibrio cidicii]